MALVLPGGETKPRATSAWLDNLPCQHCRVPLGTVGGGTVTFGKGGPWAVCRLCKQYHVIPSWPL